MGCGRSLAMLVLTGDGPVVPASRGDEKYQGQADRVSRSRDDQSIPSGLRQANASAIAVLPLVGSMITVSLLIRTSASPA